MYLNKLIKKQAFLIISTFLIVGAIVAGSSYAIFEKVESNDNDQTLTAGNLNVSFTTGSTINITSLEPMSDSTAASRSDNVYSFSVANNGSIPYVYSIILDNNPSYTSNLLGHYYIRLSVNNGSANPLSYFTNHAIINGTLAGGETKNYSVRLWIADATSYKLPNSAMGQEVHLKISIDGKAIGE